ncbi:hypothetical protein TMatcc_000546 [Talaromyces marneffei ATCC 18224]
MKPTTIDIIHGVLHTILEHEVPDDLFVQTAVECAIENKNLASLRYILGELLNNLPEHSRPMSTIAFHTKFPTELHAEQLELVKHPLIALLQKAVDRCEASEVLGAAKEFFTQFRRVDLHQVTARTSSQNFPDQHELLLPGTVKKHWSTNFVGGSDERLISALEAYEADFEQPDARKKYYSKLIMLIRSSGAGKSRLADTVGKRCLMITYVIRDHPGGYPPADSAICDFLSAHPSRAEADMMSPKKKTADYATATHRVYSIWAHATMIALMQSTLEELTNYIQNKSTSASSQEDVASMVYRALAPSNGRRSHIRCELYDKVVENAKNIRKRCIEEGGFRSCFDNVSGSQIRTSLQDSGCAAMSELRQAAVELKSTLEELPSSHPNLPRLIVAFDEVASLLSEDEYNIRYIALNRILSCISKGNPFWYLFMSTESKIDHLLPPDSVSSDQSKFPSHRPSSRGDFTLNRFPSFTTFACDIDDLKKNSTLYPKTESMFTFTSIGFMARFGRPLWLAFEEPQLVATEKILGTKQSKRLNPYVQQEVLAVLSNRLYLDFNMANPTTLPLAQDAVNCYMRDVISIDPSSGVLHTRTPNEPILSYSAMRHLFSDVSIWPQAIETFTQQLLDRGAIEKGEEGELFSRLIFTLSHDRLVRSHIIDGKFQPSHLTFKVRDFLHELYATEYHQIIDEIEEGILDAHMNFLSFSSTAEYLTGRSFQNLCYTLLRRSSALQLAPQQRTYDQLLPFYVGNPDEPFDTKKVGAILVQVKNRMTSSSIDLILKQCFQWPHANHLHKRFKERNYDSLLKDNPDTKILFILLDFGIKPSTVEVKKSCVNRPSVWAIHSKGHDADVFGCLKGMNVGPCIPRFFRGDFRKQFLAHRRCDPLHNILHLDTISQDVPGEAASEGSSEDVVMADV